MANNNVQITSNEILDFDTYSKSQKQDMKTVITNNIIYDYQVGGVKTTKVSIFLSTMKNQKGDILRDMSKGEIIKINDIVCVMTRNNSKEKASVFKDSDGNMILFKVTGRTFKYKGQPLIELELQQVKGDYTWVSGLKVIQI